MGAALDTPAKCPLCNEFTSDLVTLKCNHRFCQRCIGDLWSVAPDGPYNCPQWKCKTAYQTLPFDRTLIPWQSSGSKRTPPHRSGAGRLLGKRKASTPVAEQPDTKRSTVEARREQPGDVESPSASSSASASSSSSSPTDTPAPPSSLEVPHASESKQAEPEPEASCARSPADLEPRDAARDPPVQLAARDPPVQLAARDPLVLAAARDPPVPLAARDPPVPLAARDPPVQLAARDPPVPLAERDPPVPLAEQVSVEAALQDDNDSLDEVILCDGPPAATPQRDAREVPALLVRTNSSAGLPPDEPKSPPRPASTSQAITTIDLTCGSPTILSGSPSTFSGFFKSENKSGGPVPCNYCSKVSCQNAIKTCLVCGASMCSEHLRSHLESPVFRNHTLVPPVEDLSTWRCQEHQEVNRIYCPQCNVCVCTVCTVIGSHRGHPCISVREAEMKLRGNLRQEIAQLQQFEENVSTKVKELAQKRDTSRAVLNEARAIVQQQYTAIREALDEEERVALQCVGKEESRVLGGLDETVGRLKSSLQSIQQGLHILEGLADAKGDKYIGEQAFIMEYSKTSHLASAMGGYVKNIEYAVEVDHARLQCLQRWTEKRLDTVVITVPGKEGDLYRLLYGYVPSLDADTAHPKLQLFDNSRGVTYSEAQQPYSEHAARFSSFPQVLASCALQGGCWYWEVKVSVDEGRWKVGVCEGQIERKGQKDTSRLGCNPYSWCLACDKKKVEALHNKVSEPVDVDGLQRMGVFLDLEVGVLSFFNVTPGGSLALMHSYKHSFTDPVYPAFSVSKTHLAICDLFHS